MTASAKSTKKTKQISSPFWRRYPRRTVAIAIAGFLVLWLLGVPQHSYYFARCGGNMPTRFTKSVMPSFASGWPIGYFIPTDSAYYDPPYLWTTTFYCTEQQAIDAGLVPDDFSDLKQHLPSPSIYKAE